MTTTPTTARDLESAVLAELRAKQGNGHRATRTATIRGVLVTCEAAPAYSQRAQRVHYRITWKIEGKKASAAKVAAL